MDNVANQALTVSKQADIDDNQMFSLRKHTNIGSNHLDIVNNQVVTDDKQLVTDDKQADIDNIHTNINVNHATFS